MLSIWALAVFFVFHVVANKIKLCKKSYSGNFTEIIVLSTSKAT